MRISVLCSDPAHPVMPRLEDWCRQRLQTHQVELVGRTAELSGGDLLFLVSCSELVRDDTRLRYRATLVLHASDLPQGRGWSPLVWQILEGRNEIAVTLLEAAEPVDSGPIWAQRWLHFEGHELLDEINAALFAAELDLMDDAIDRLDSVTPRPQRDTAPTWYRKRRPEDSRLDPQGSLAEQFDLLRVADPERYPAFFELRGHRYALSIRKVDRNDP